jgi:hypothetical protein
MILDRLEAGLPVTVYVLHPTGTDAPRSASCTSTRDADRPGVTARTVGVTGAGAGGEDDVTSPVYDGCGA